MAERIYILNQSEELQPLTEEPFRTEELLQRLLANHPELLDGEQMRPGDPRRWILIGREKSIADKVDTGARWSVDHLLVDQDAIPTLVEVKRGTNTEIRRTVVGQLLEYAAHASQTWTADELRRAFEAGDGADNRLANLLQSKESRETDADEFWERVATNLAARRLRLLFVADQIPDELARVVEFLNEQMPDVEVLAVEIKRFRGESLTTLVPQVIGRTAAKRSGGSNSNRPKITFDKFFGQFTDRSAAEAARRLMSAAKEAGAVISPGDKGFSVRVPCSFQRQPVSIAWLYPSIDNAYWAGFKGFTFGTSNWIDFPAEAQSVVDEMHRLFEEDTFTEKVGSTVEDSSQGWAIAPVVAAEHIELLEERLATTISKLRKL